jgi:ABC-type Zn uptake system ZnuABC Zn-binding protein ZnuA
MPAYVLVALQGTQTELAVEIEKAVLDCFPDKKAEFEKRAKALADERAAAERAEQLEAATAAGGDQKMDAVGNGPQGGVP